MSWLLALPIMLPFITAVVVFLLRKNGLASRWISVGGCAALLVVAVALLVEVLRHGVITGQMGDWPAPFGITLVADLLSAVMVVITAITGLAVAIYATADIDGHDRFARHRRGTRHHHRGGPGVLHSDRRPIW